MSAISDSASLVLGGVRSSLYAGHGVRGDAIPSTGADGPSYLFPCVTLPADAAVEIRGYITRWPTLGALTPQEDGSFVYIGASDYFDFRLYGDGVASTVDIGFGAGIARVYLNAGGALPTGRTVTLRLVDKAAGGVALPSLTGLKWAFYDTTDPSAWAAGPVDKGSGESADGSGDVIFSLPNTTLTAGQAGWLIVTDSDGTVTQSPPCRSFCGPVTVA